MRKREEKKKGKTAIDRQFEYNTYIRDFFADNEGRSLEEAIRCWKYKKGLKLLFQPFLTIQAL